MPAAPIYHGSDGAATRAYYAALTQCRPYGPVAVALMRASKASTRAKQYRGGPGCGQPSYRRLAYDRKSWSLQEVCKALLALSPAQALVWGWGRDLAQPAIAFVLYVDLAYNGEGIGQCSFHNQARHAGPDYPGAWDGTGLSTERILAFCDAVWEGMEQHGAQIGLFAQEG